MAYNLILICKMIGEISFFLIVSLGSVAVWSYIEKQQWPEDYSIYQAEYFEPQLIPNYQDKIVENYFDNATMITDQKLFCPEDIAVDSKGIIYSGLTNGKIVRINQQGNIQILNEVEGNLLLGIIITADDSTLYFLASDKGLCKMDIATRKLTYLLKYGGALNNLALDEHNQIIYMTYSSPIHMKFSNKQTLLKKNFGKILAFHLQNSFVEVIKEGLYFPNGIVYEKSTQSVLVAELNRYRIIRVSVQEQSKGNVSIIKDNLIGFPDNMKLNQKGQLLVAFPTTRNPLLNFLDKTPWLRKILIYLPEKIIFSVADKVAAGIRLDPSSGQILQYLMGAPKRISMITTVLQRNGKTYFSSLLNPTILILNNLDKPGFDNAQKDSKEL